MPVRKGCAPGADGVKGDPGVAVFGDLNGLGWTRSNQTGTLEIKSSAKGGDPE